MGKPKKAAKIAGRSKGLAQGPAADKNTRYTVAHVDNVALLKYGRSADMDGLTYEMALELSQRAHADQPAYTPVTVAEYEAAKASDTTVTLRDVVAARVAARAEAAAA